MNREEFIQDSIELNLFWSRIMKEHCIFIEAGLPYKDMNLMQSYDRFKVQFEMLLFETSEISGNLPAGAASSGIFLTEYTPEAESRTQALTGISINHRVTQAQKNALEKPRPMPIGKLPAIYDATRAINAKADSLARGLMELQNRTLDEVLDGKLFTYNYPAAYMHMNDEAQQYLNNLELLSMNENINTAPCAVQQFWDNNMRQHAASIRGLLDPTEAAMFGRADNFVKDYAALHAETEAACAENAPLSVQTEKAVKLTGEFKRFKTEATKAILCSRLKSIILPLYADHQLREANYYLRLL